MGKTEVDYQKGIFFYAVKRPFDAITYLRNVQPKKADDFGLHSILVQAYRDIGSSEGERKMLQRLVDIDDGRVRREMPWVYADLGRIYERDGYTTNAADLYEKYVQALPDDSLSAVFRKKIDAWKVAEKAGAKR